MSLKNQTPIILGQAINAVSASQLMPLGTVVNTDDQPNGQAIYVQSLSILAQFSFVVIDDDSKASNLSIANSTTETGIGRKVGVVQQSVPSGNYCWAHISGGKIRGKVAQACADRVPLFPTSTVGVVDDATSSVAYILGLHTVSTTSTVSAVTLMMATTCVTFPWSNPA